MSCDLSLYVGNSNVVELQALTNSVTGTVDTGATVTAVVKDTAGNNVTGETWPVTLAHDTGGTYRATLDDALAVVAGRQYTVEVTATGSGGEVGAWSCCVTAEKRGC